MASAVDVEKLLMPGEVITGHAEVEAQCASCHQPFRAEAQDQLCRDCHEEVAEDVDSGRGFHGRSPAVTSSRCQSCHTEHKGRDADIVGLNPATFDHGLTDFVLDGAHGKTPCAGCHKPDAKPRDAPGACVDCHRDDDPHEDRFGNDCGDCHRSSSWAAARFDHDETRFVLRGAHQEVACSLCHPATPYKGTPTDCVSCHRLDDVHRSGFGNRCETCHEPRGWERIRFDHDQETKFPLEGKHRDVSCEGCHGDSPLNEIQNADCNSCHRLDDVHAGGHGVDCGSCHTVKSWKTVTFDHDRDTSFPLKWAHSDRQCRECHVETPKADAPARTCHDCHEEDDVHRGQEGESCARCHEEKKWTDPIIFEHDLTRFPLLGLHATASCEECHAGATFRDAESPCIACHTSRDHHRGEFGKECDHCHTPNAWDVWRFDHGEQTKFPLHGAHEGLECRFCHEGSVVGEVPTSTRCVACHSKDDSHFGEFGQRCEECHTDDSWHRIRLGR